MTDTQDLDIFSVNVYTGILVVYENANTLSEAISGTKFREQTFPHSDHMMAEVII